MTDATIQAIARSMHRSKAWPAVFAAGSAELLAQAAIKTLNLTPSAASALMDGTATVVPSEPTDEQLMALEKAGGFNLTGYLDASPPRRTGDKTMTTEDRKAFEEWLASEPSLIRAPSYDATAELAWQAATARERERCASIADNYGNAAMRLLRTKLEDRERHEAQSDAADFIAAAIRNPNGGNPDDR